MGSKTETPPAATEIIVERPEHGLAQGQYAWPNWGIVLVGSLGVVLGLLFVIFRLRSQRRRS